VVGELSGGEKVVGTFEVRGSSRRRGAFGMGSLRIEGFLSLDDWSHRQGVSEQ